MKRTAFLLLTLLLVTSSMVPKPVHAATQTYQVDTNLDDSSKTGCLGGTANDCSLRGAISKANSLGGADTYVINLPAGTYTLTIPGRNEDDNATGDLDVKANIQLVGAGADTTTIDAAGIDRVMEHLGSQPLTISGVSLCNGSILDGGGGGAGIRLASSAATTISQAIIRNNVSNGYDLGGGISLISSSLTIQDSTIRDNWAFTGGGLYSSGGSMDIQDSTFSSNHANTSEGLGGGIRQQSTAQVTLERSILSGNAAFLGGGYSSSNQGQAAFTDVLFSTNQATNGGGISLQNSVTMDRTSLTGNQAEQGGGIYMVDNLSMLDFRNGTITANTANIGGGILTWNAHLLSFVHATLAGNLLNGGGSGTELYIDYDTEEGTFTVSNSILAGSVSGKTCWINTDLVNLVSLGYNLGNDASCNLVQPSDQANTDPGLGGLWVNGYHAVVTLLAGSPAIDRAGSSLLEYPVDELGRGRVDGDQDGTVVADIGAFEFYFTQMIVLIQK